MRIARLLSPVLAIVAAGILLAPTAGSTPPFRLPGYVTDEAGVLSDADRSNVTSAIDSLYSSRKTRLWVVYVESFSGQTAETWARNTMRASDLGDFDALLAVATVDRAYAFLVPDSATELSSSRVDSLRRNEIEPALGESDWAGAAVAAASGLDESPGSGSISWVGLLVALAVIALALALLLLWRRRRRRKRREAEFAAARRVDPTDPQALAAVSLDALDDMSKAMVVEVDNALRTSDHELDLALGEFGEKETEPFVRAVNNAKITLAQAFNVRQQLDDAIPETPAQRRDLLTRVVVAAAKADRELDARGEAFAKLRDLVINAPTRLDAMRQQVVDITARLGPSEQKLTALHSEFDDAALTSVSGNVDAAKELLSFADQNITRGRELADRPMAGRQTELVECVRAAEASLAQARSLLDAVDSAASDIRRAAATLPAAIEDIQNGIKQAGVLLQGSTPQAAQLAQARDAAAAAVATAQRNGSQDPLGSFTQLTKADADLDRLLAAVEEQREAAERLNRALDEAMFTARSRVRSVSDFIDTRRGIVGPEARTRLAEAVRHIGAADAKRSTDPAEAIAHANGASMLAAQAQSLASADVQNAQRSYMGPYGGGRGGGNMGAILGGILIGNVLSGGFGGGFGGGGFSTGSFGGSGGGGGMFGGGGRF